MNALYLVPEHGLMTHTVRAPGHRVTLCITVAGVPVLQQLSFEVVLVLSGSPLQDSAGLHYGFEALPLRADGAQSAAFLFICLNSSPVHVLYVDLGRQGMLRERVHSLLTGHGLGPGTFGATC